jgi:hypothetical protein
VTMSNRLNDISTYRWNSLAKLMTRKRIRVNYILKASPIPCCRKKT